MNRTIFGTTDEFNFPYIDIDLPKDAIYKHNLMMLDIIRSNNWERPVYFSGGSIKPEDYAWMQDYLQLEGMVFKLGI